MFTDSDDDVCGLGEDDFAGVDMASESEEDSAPAASCSVFAPLPADPSPSATFALNTGHQMPIVGLGVYQAPPGDVTYRAVRWALELGYRLIDTAAMYNNEEAVGRAVRDSGVPRAEVFVTTKLAAEHHGFDAAIVACKESLAQLGLDYIDLYLIHSPYGQRLVETYDALSSLKADGLIRSAGVSNFGVAHLLALEQHGRPPPAVNQIEMHPLNFNQRRALLDHCKERRIVIIAYGSMLAGKVAADAAADAAPARAGLAPVAAALDAILAAQRRANGGGGARTRAQVRDPKLARGEYPMRYQRGQRPARPRRTAHSTH
jgi:diketogulonate reductase-like aldo/keto reductase